MLWRSLSVLALALAVASSALAQVPYTFTNGQPADADQVNANFDALVTALDALTARVDALEASTTGSIAGTYVYFEVTTDVDALGPNSYGMAGGGAFGTVVLNSDGTGTVDITSQYRQLSFWHQSLLVGNVDNTGSVGIESTGLNLNDSPETIDTSITWSLSDGVVTVSTGDDDLGFLVAGRILVNSISSTDGEGHNGIALLVRR
jgi:hypothetical protein